MTETAPAASDPSMRDRVTGLGNRRALLIALRERVPAGHGALVLLDLDGFRRATERVPRPAVDALLLEAAGRLRAAAGPEALLYRYAADAFCLLLPGADKDRAARSADELRAALSRQPFSLLENPRASARLLPLTASASACSYPVDGRSPTVLIEAAELALFVAKHSGRDRTAVAGRLDPAALAEIGVFRGLPCPILVGRVAEQSKLRQLASDVRHVGPGAALLTGPPGVGKTRLLRELALWARSERFVVLSGTCQESRVSIPYAALSEVVENLLATDRATVQDALRGLAPEHRAALSVVLRDFPAGLETKAVPITEYARAIWDAFGAFLDALSRIGPLLILLDEAEYADLATFDVFRAAIGRRVPFLVAAATDLGPGDFGRTRAGDFFREREATAVTLPLSPLAPEEMRQMLHAIIPDAECAPEAVEQLVTASAGNPLYLEEALRSLLLRGKIRLSRGRWSLPALAAEDIPADLEGAVRAVSRALPARANTLLTGAAVIGSHVDPDLLQEVMGQDDAEMLDLIDEARRARLLVTSDTEADLLTFPASHARRVRLAASDASQRQEIHGRVGVVQEARHGGDAAHLADELAFHYGKAGNEARARHFDAVARRRAALIQPPKPEGVRRARLDPFKEALPPPAQERALAVMRHFAGALKVGRLYPQWSQVSTSFLVQLRDELKALLAACPGVTIAAAAIGPTINGAISDSSVAADFAALLDERLIESITLQRAFDPAKMDTVVREFMQPFDRVRAEGDHWDRFLNRERLEAFDIVQKAYQARERDVRGVARAKEEPVPPDRLPELRDALRHLKAAVDNLRLYPPGHSLVEETATQACRSLTEFVTQVKALSLGTAEGELVVNGRPGDRKFFGEGGAFLVREIDQRKLKSVFLGAGLTEDEVRALVSFFSLPAEGSSAQSAQLLHAFRHVDFGSMEYSRAEEGVRQVELAAPPKPIRSEIRAREILARPYAQFLSTDLEQMFPVLVETLAYGAGKPLAEQLVDRLGTHFGDAQVRHRRKAYDLLARSLAFASPGTRRLEVSRSAPALRQRLLEDAVPEQVRPATDVLPLWIPAAATVGCLRELAELAGPVLRKRAESPETPPDIALACESVLLEIPKTAAYPVLLATLQKPKAEERVSAISILLAVGGEAMQRLAEVFIEEPEIGLRRSMAFAMGLAAPQIAGEVVKSLGLSPAPDRLARVLEVAEPLLCPPFLTHLGELAEKGPAEARRAILQAMERWPAASAVPIVRQLLVSTQEANRVRAIELGTRLRLPHISPEVGKLLEATEDEELLKRCSAYFEAVPNPVVAPLLVRIAERRPKFLGLVKGYSAATRAAAVVALARQGAKQAEEALKLASADRDVRVLAEAAVQAAAAPAPPPAPAAPPVKKPF
jgi:diguanylate cyclase (GGDEF)-like protein